MAEEIKTDVDRLLLVLIMKINLLIYFVELTFFFHFRKPKIVYLRQFLSSLPFPKFWKQNFMYFEHKHAGT